MAKNVIQDDVFDHLESDIEKIRVRYRQYISYSDTLGAKSVVMEAINNALDECRSPRSKGNKIDITFNEETGILSISDNGRGIPIQLVEKIFTSLNMGSNIKTGNKASLKAETLGQNGTGSLAICGLAEHCEIISRRGAAEGKVLHLVFEEGVKLNETISNTGPKDNGMTIIYKPSKVMGKNTRIVWSDIYEELLNLQYLNKDNITIKSSYYSKKGELEEFEYARHDFQEILTRNKEGSGISQKINIPIAVDDITEELDGEKIKRYLCMETAFMYVNDLNPYINSFSNSNNTVDNGDHLEGAIESLCRFLQNATKETMSVKEKERLDIKWDDVKSGLSVCVALRTNYESLYTGQTKHKVVSKEIKKIIQDAMQKSLVEYFSKRSAQLKELITIIKMNARVRREGDKVKNSVVKATLTNWSSFKMKCYDPCTNKGKEYKELYIIEGDYLCGESPNSFNCGKPFRALTTNLSW